MRARSEMITQVERLLNDSVQDTFGSTAVQRALTDALSSAARQLANSPIGKKHLRQHTDAASFEAGVETYDRPDRQLGVERVEYRRDSTARWRSAEYRPPQSGRTAPPLYWFDDVASGQVRIWPAFDAVNGEQYRLRYYATPRFPQDDTGSFNDPYGDSSELHRYPEQLDLICEYGAALNLAAEEDLNTTPIQHLRNEYNRVLMSLIGGTANVPRDKQNRRMYTRDEEND